MKRAIDYSRSVMATEKILKRLDFPHITELLRKNEVGTENDGIRSKNYDPTRMSTGGASDVKMTEGGEMVPVTASDADVGEDTLTEAAALRGIDPESVAQWTTNDANQRIRRDDWRRHEQLDPIGDAINAVLAGIEEMGRLAESIERHLSVAVNAADGYRGRQPTDGPCQGCGRPVPGTPVDRLKGGYCMHQRGLPWSGCHNRWLASDERKADRRMAFELRMVEESREALLTKVAS